MPHWLTGKDTDEDRISRRAREAMVRAKEELENPKAGTTVPEDLRAIAHRVITGVPMAPIPGCWRW